MTLRIPTEDPARPAALRALLLVLLFSLPILITIRPVRDLDIWWHLREGQWIIEHHTVPVTDPFSSYGAGKRWLAYSWLFEVVVYGLYHAFGLLGLVLYTASMAVLITLALHGLVRQAGADFTIACILTAGGVIAMAPVLVHPRPWLLTIFFFTLELYLIGVFRRAGRPWPLLLLPPLFALWASINIQFVYGLFVLAIATIEPLAERPWTANARARQVLYSPMAALFAACLLATLVNPYGFRVYVPVFEAVTLTKPFLFLQELEAPRFRSVFDWTMLAVTLGGAYTLGRSGFRRAFPTLLLPCGAFLSFRAARDVWFVVVVALMIMAAHGPKAGRVVERLAARWRFVVAVAVAAVAAVIVPLRVSRPALEQALAQRFPETAAAIVEQHGYAGIIYNDYDWGGYLIWRLPTLMVNMDGRNPLHGDTRILRSVATWSGREGWDKDPELAAAGIVIGNRKSALVSLLRRDARFDLVHEDEVAVVFVPHR
jgi:hypothetical protein